MPINFVKAGQLGLAIFYSTTETRFYVHERLLTIPGARKQLGLEASGDVGDADIAMQAVWSVFMDALSQLPDKMLSEPAAMPIGARRRFHLHGAHQLLLNWSRLLSFKLDWSPDTSIVTVTRPIHPDSR